MRRWYLWIISVLFADWLYFLLELIDQEVNQIKERVDANDAYAKNITTWIKDNLGVNLENIDQVINQKLTARLEQQDADLKSREESLWKIFNVKYNTAVNQFEGKKKKET